MTKRKTSVKQDLALRDMKAKTKHTEKKYEQLLVKLEEMQATLEAFEFVRPTHTHTIKPKLGHGTGEAVAVVLASDWHIEERVDSEVVNGKNEYSLVVANHRVHDFFRGVLRITEITGRDTNISTMVLALLGDFISGDIHEELLETAECEPIHAALRAKDMIASGIQFLLDNTKLDLVIPCHSGNHARTTKKSRNATEAGHSLEYIMYHFLAEHFAGEPRVKFMIPKSYHSYIKIYGVTLRFHHGHAIRYQGGVGGLTIPVNKAVAQWNKLRQADIDCFG